MIFVIYVKNDDDDDYEPEEDSRKKKKGKKRKAKSGEESSRRSGGRKKKKRKKNDSDEDPTEYVAPVVEEVAPVESPDEFANLSKRSRKRKEKEKEAAAAAAAKAEEEEAMPSVSEVCTKLDLKDVEIEYNDNHYQNLVTYKMFQAHVRPILQKENGRAAMSKLMMLVAAKWREFCEQNPNLQVDEVEEPAAEPDLEYLPKPSRSRSNRNEKVVVEEEDDAGEDEEEEEEVATTSRLFFLLNVTQLIQIFNFIHRSSQASTHLRSFISQKET